VLFLRLFYLGVPHHAIAARRGALVDGISAKRLHDYGPRPVRAESILYVRNAGRLHLPVHLVPVRLQRVPVRVGHLQHRAVAHHPLRSAEPLQSTHRSPAGWAVKK